MYRPRMRALLLVGVVLGGLAWGSRADAAEATGAPSGDPAPVHSSVPMAPEDWIPVLGIACYVVIPAILVIAGVVAYVSWVRSQAAEPTAALLRAPLRPPPPRGVILLRF